MRNQIPTMKQGIVAVLGPESICNEPASIRRTLSADMSSKNQLQYSEEFHRDDVWRSIQKNPKTESWDSMLSRKKEPYVKRSLSGLSDESLEICTERLGSESGSDCFPSPTECLSEGYKVKEQGKLSGRVAKFKTFPVRSLPPPLPSISQLHMQSRRENGRLIVQAVSVSPGNYFEARRGGGRLVLIFVRRGQKMVAESERPEEVFGDMEDVPVVEELVVDVKSSFTNAKIGVCNKGLVMKKFVANKEEIPILKSLSLPPMVARLIPPPAAATSATSFNTYEYFWRNKTPENEDSDNKKKKNVVYENENMVMVKGNKGEDLVPYSRGCKVPKRSLLFWEPYCVATK